MELASALDDTPQYIGFMLQVLDNKNTIKKYNTTNLFVKPVKLSKGNGKFRTVFIYAKRFKKILSRISILIQETIPVSSLNLAYEKGCSIGKASELLKGHTLVCSADFKDHFSSIIRSQVKHMLIANGYPANIAWCISRLTCVRYNGRDFLPQGSPASPFISNRVTEILLDGAIQEAIPDAEYYRYSDNLYLCFNDKKVTGTEVLKKLDAAVRSNVKWKLHKLKVMPYYRRQRGLGLTLNSGARMPREEYDKLKAVLHNSCKCLNTAWQRSNATGFIESSSTDEFILKLSCKVKYWINFVNENQKQKLEKYMEIINEHYKAQSNS